MIRCENNKVIMEGTGYELLNEYSAIHKEMILEFGPDLVEEALLKRMMFEVDKMMGAKSDEKTD